MTLIWVTAERIDGAQENVSYEHFKDLLLFVNPLLGVVIGYYFNKVSTEARAESAERSLTTANNVAQAATSTAQQASEDRKLAQNQASQAAREAAARGEVLSRLTEASSKFLEHTVPSDTARVDGGTDSDYQQRLRSALEEARSVLRSI